MKRTKVISTTVLAGAISALVSGTAIATEPCDDFGECKALIEINSSDGDIGFHFLMDGDDLNSAEIQDPNYVTIFQDSAGGPLLEQKLTETFAESAEPVCRNGLKEDPDDVVVTLAEFLDRWTAGTYYFFGTGDEEMSAGETELTFDIPAAPTDVDFDGSVITWDSGDDLGECATHGHLNGLVMSGALPTHPEDVTVDVWEVVFEPDVEDGDLTGQLTFTVRLAGDIETKAVTVPAEYLADLPPDTLAKIEVGAIGGEDNATFTEEDGFCVNEDEGCVEEE